MPEQKKTGEQPPEPKPKGKRRILRMLGCAFLIGTFLLIAAVVALKVYLTDQRIRKILIELADTHLQKGALTLDKLNFRIASGLTIEGITIENHKADSDGKVLQIEKVVVKYDLTSLARGKLLINKVIVTNPVLVLSQKNGRWNYQDFIPEGPAARPKPAVETSPFGAIWLPLNIDAQKFSIENLHVRLKADPGIEIDITGANINASAITEGFGEKATIAETLTIESVKIKIASVGDFEFSVEHQLDLESNLIQGDLDKFVLTLKLPGLAEQKLSVTGKGFGKTIKLEEFVLETNLADLKQKLGPIFTKFIQPFIKGLNIEGIVKVKAGGQGALAKQLDESSIQLHGTIETKSDISAASPELGITGLETKTKYALNLPLFNPIPRDIEVSGTVKWQKLTGLDMATIHAGTVSWQVAAADPSTELKATIESDISRIDGIRVQDNTKISAIIEGIKSHYEANLTSLSSGNLVTSGKTSIGKITLKQEGPAAIATVVVDDVKTNLKVKTDIEELSPVSELSITTGRLVATQKTPTGESNNASAEATSTELNLKTVDFGRGKIEINIQNSSKAISCETPVAAVGPLDAEISLKASSVSLIQLQSGVLDISKLQISVKELLQTNLVAAINLKEGHIKLDQSVEINFEGAKKFKLKSLPLHQHGLESGGKISGEIHLEGRLPTDDQIHSFQLPLNLTLKLQAADLFLGMNGIRWKMGEGALKFTHSPDQRFELTIDNQKTEISVTSLEGLGRLIEQELPEVQINAQPDLSIQIEGAVPTPKQISELSFDLKLTSVLKTNLEASLANEEDKTELKSKEIGLKTNLIFEEDGNVELSFQLETQPNEIGFQLAEKHRRVAIPGLSLNVPLRINLSNKTVDTYEGVISYKIGDWATGEIEIEGGLDDGVVLTQVRELHFQPILEALGPIIQDVTGIKTAITGSLKDKLRINYKAGASGSGLKGSEFDASLRLDLDFEFIQLNDGKLFNLPGSLHNDFDISVTHSANSPLVKFKYVQVMPQTAFRASGDLFSIFANVLGVKTEIDIDYDLDRQIADLKGKSRKVLSDLKVAVGEIEGGGKSFVHELKLNGSYDHKKKLATVEARLVNTERELEVNAGMKVQIPEIDETYHFRVVHDFNTTKLPVVELDLSHASKVNIPGLFSGEISSLKVRIRNKAETPNIFTAIVDSKVINSEFTLSESKVQSSDILADVNVETLNVKTGDGRVTASVSSTSFGNEFKVDVLGTFKKWADVFSIDLKLHGLDIAKVNGDMLKPIMKGMELPFLLGDIGGVVNSEVMLFSSIHASGTGKASASPKVSGRAKLSVSDLIVEAGIPGFPTKAALLGDPEGEQTEDAIFGVEDGTLELNLELPEGSEVAKVGLAFDSTFFVDTSSGALEEPAEVRSKIDIHLLKEPLIHVSSFSAMLGDILQARLNGKVVPSDLTSTFLTLSLEITPQELLANLEEDLVVGLFGGESFLEGKVSVSSEARGNSQTNSLEITNSIKVDFPEIGFGTLASIQELEANVTAKTSLSLEAFEPGKIEMSGSFGAGESAFLDSSIALVGIEESKFKAAGSSLAELASSLEIIIYELGYEDQSIALPAYDLEISAAAVLDAVKSNVQLDEFILSILKPPAEEGGDPYEWFTLGPMKGRVKEGGKEISMSTEGTILDLSVVAETLARIVPEVFTDVLVKGEGLSWNVAVNSSDPSESDKGSNQYRLLKALMGAVPPQLVEKLSVRVSLPRHKIEMDLWGVAFAADGKFSFELAKDDLKIDGVLKLDEISGLEALKVQPTAFVKIDLANLSDLRFETGLNAANGISANTYGRVTGLEFLYGAGSLDTSLANMIEQLGGNIGLEVSLGLEEAKEVVPDVTISGKVTVKGDVQVKRNDNIAINGSAELSSVTFDYADILNLAGLNGRVPFRKRFRTQTSRSTQSESGGLSGELNVDGSSVRQEKQRWRFQKQFASYRSDVRPLQFEKLAYKGRTIISDFVMPLSVIDGELRIDSFKMKLLNGDVSASVSVAAVNGTPQLRINGEFVGIAGGDVSSSKGKDVGGIRGDFNLLLEIDETGKSGGISELRGALHITQIGKRELLRIIDVLDPQRAQPDLNTIRTALGIGRPDRVEFKIRHGSLSGKVTLSLPIGKSEIPIGEIPLTRVIRSKSIQKTLDKSLEAAANLIFMLSAETLIIGEGDQIRFE